jgi:hypothetical protein
VGYSCTALASSTLDALQERFRHDGSGNTYSTDGGRTRFFWERGREQPDGAMTGTIIRWLDNEDARRAGSYRIDPDGTIVRFPGIPRKYWAEIQAEGKRAYDTRYGRTAS